MFLRFKGIDIQYTSCGTGTPLVFLHGFLENATMWDGILPSFSADYQCICIDLLGHGQTANIGYIHTMEDMAEAVRVVLVHLRIKDAVFIGHSMGGYVALSIVSLFPNIVSGVVLLNSTSAPDSEERKSNRDRAIAIVKKNPNAYTSMAIANLFAAENRSIFHKEIEKIKDGASKTSLQGIIAALEGMKIRKDHSITLTTFSKSKLIMAGKKDPVLLYASLEKEAKVTNTVLIPFSGGHMTYLENKKEMIATVQHFLIDAVEFNSPRLASKCKK